MKATPGPLSILCSACFDAVDGGRVCGLFPQMVCARCGRLCMGYGSTVAVEGERPTDG
jgi:hypothetical protein